MTPTSIHPMSPDKVVDYFEHDADVGIIGRGATLEQAFENAARAMFAIITNIDAVVPKTVITVEFEETDPELALVIWLNHILGTARQHGMVFNHFQLRRTHNHWHGELHGESWRDNLERGTEVKGATFTMLSVQSTEGIWEARCVVDV